MHADDLRVAVSKIVEVLSSARIAAVVNQYRASRGGQRTVAAARLGHAGAMIMERFEAMSASERTVVSMLHLDSLCSADYWKSLLEGTDDPKVQQAEIVRLATRVMFASNNLPGLINLLDTVSTAPVERFRCGDGEARLVVRLVDAGERASDPDRIARSVDGIDMLYSACASIARKPAMDLRLEAIDGSDVRDLHFTGESDSTTAVTAVIDSIPGALAEIGPNDDINLDNIVASLPVFQDLKTLASLGNFSENDLKDITETMHQGALLVLESGVVTVDSTANAAEGASEKGAMPQSLFEKKAPAPRSNGAAAVPSSEEDEHYERYLREREAMQQPSNGSTANMNGGGEPGNRKDAIDELLKSLGKARGDG